MTKTDGFYGFNFHKGYQPWGALRRKNLMARLLRGAGLLLIGVATLCAMALMAAFAATIALVGFILAMFMTLMTRFTPKAVELKVRTQKDGTIIARKVGNSWMPY